MKKIELYESDDCMQFEHEFTALLNDLLYALGKAEKVGLRTDDKFDANNPAIRASIHALNEHVKQFVAYDRNELETDQLTKAAQHVAEHLRSAEGMRTLAKAISSTRRQKARWRFGLR